jgi:hypothetical protein
MTATTISEGFIRDLYLENGREKKDPALQILSFEISESNHKEVM